jgi:hypothetical protein
VTDWTDLAEYESTCRRWCSQDNSPQRNATFVANQTLFKSIRSSEAGQSLIRRLAVDAEDCVAGHAATHSLWFDETFGMAILARIAQANSEAGLSAKWTLRELSRGALSLDW